MGVWDSFYTIAVDRNLTLARQAKAVATQYKEKCTNTSTVKLNLCLTGLVERIYAYGTYRSAKNSLPLIILLFLGSRRPNLSCFYLV